MSFWRDGLLCERERAYQRSALARRFENVIGRVDDPASLGARIVFGERPQPCGGKPADQHHDLHPLLPISHASSFGQGSVPYRLAANPGFLVTTQP